MFAFHFQALLLWVPARRLPRLPHLNPAICRGCILKAYGGCAAGKAARPWVRTSWQKPAMGTSNRLCISGKKGLSRADERFLQPSCSSPLRFLIKQICCPMQIYLLALTEEEVSSCQVTGSKALWHLQKTNNPDFAFYFPGQSTVCSMACKPMLLVGSGLCLG